MPRSRLCTESHRIWRGGLNGDGQEKMSLSIGKVEAKSQNHVLFLALHNLNYSGAQYLSTLLNESSNQCISHKFWSMYCVILVVKFS